MRQYVKNDNGVEGYWSHSGTHFGNFVKDEDGKERFRAALPLFVPKVCDECIHLDRGEYGEYGSLLAGPYCMKNMWFPVRKGTCKAQEKDD